QYTVSSILLCLCVVISILQCGQIFLSLESTLQVQFLDSCPHFFRLHILGSSKKPLSLSNPVLLCPFQSSCFLISFPISQQLRFCSRFLHMLSFQAQPVLLKPNKLSE